MKNVFYYRFDQFVEYWADARFGGVTIGIAEEGDAITELFFQSHVPVSFRKAESRKVETPLIQETALQLGQYLAGERRDFSIPLATHGTEFHKIVWDALLTIPYGETRSYKNMAEQIGRPNAARALGLANNRNPISIIIPCHRVIAHNGSLVGYGGGLALKRYLLEFERGRRGYKFP